MSLSTIEISHCATHFNVQIADIDMKPFDTLCLKMLNYHKYSSATVSLEFCYLILCLTRIGA